MRRATTPKTNSLDQEIRDLALAALQNSNRFAEYHAKTDFSTCHPPYADRNALEALCRRLRDFADNLGQLKCQAEILENKLSRAASRGVKE